MREKGLVIKVEHDTTAIDGVELVAFTTGLGARQRKKQREIFVRLNPRQLRAVTLYHRQLPENIGTGTVEVSILHDDKLIRWLNFYPFHGVKKVKPPTGLGVGSLVHQAVVEYLSRTPRLRRYNITHVVVSDSRKRQLTLMGINPFETCSLIDYLKKTRSTVEQRFGKGKRIFV